MDDHRHWTLDAYEEQRTAAKSVQSDARVSLAWNALNDQLKCPICLSLLTDTMTVMECMHRFCNECIETSLRQGKKECPTCRKPCPSRRSLRADTDFDKLIELIYPDRNVYEHQQEAVMAMIRQNHNSKALVESIKDGLEKQKAAARRRGSARRSHSGGSVHVGGLMAAPHGHYGDDGDDGSADHPGDDEDSHDSPDSKRMRLGQAGGTTAESAPLSAIPRRMPDSDPIEFILEPHPAETKLAPLKRKYLCTPAGCTIANLCRYLNMLLSPERVTPQRFYVSTVLESGETYLHSNRTVKTVLLDHRKTDVEHPLVIYYRLDDDESDEPKAAHAHHDQ